MRMRVTSSRWNAHLQRGYLYPGVALFLCSSAIDRYWNSSPSKALRLFASSHTVRFGSLCTIDGLVYGVCCIIY
jgi:hypothetical protein